MPGSSCILGSVLRQKLLLRGSLVDSPGELKGQIYRILDPSAGSAVHRLAVRDEKKGGSKQLKIRSGFYANRSMQSWS
jgi:hypothetical protein